MEIDYTERFIAEALELLSSIENASLNLEKSPDDHELIEEVFRGLHTLKGTGAMFGFSRVEHLMHLLENIYDNIRKGEQKINSNTINLTLEAIDKVERLLNVRDNENPEIADEIRLLEIKISQNTNAVSEKQNLEVSYTQNDDIKTYFIKFIQEENIENRGFKVETVFKELNNSGKPVYISHNQDDNGEIIWDIFFASLISITDIEDFFIFYSDLVEIHHISNENLFEYDEFNSFIKKHAEQKKQANYTELKELTDRITFHIKDKNASDGGKNSGLNKTVFLKIEADKIDEQMNLLSELVTAKAEMRLIVGKENYKKLSKVVESIDKITNRFRKNILKIRLIPLKALQVRFERAVRDICGKLGKEIDFTAIGLDTELDVNIIDSLEAPLIHLLRNSIDHGIESSEIRLKNNKSAKGKIELKAYYSAAHIFIELTDDGKGIDKEYIKEKAISKGLIHPGIELTDKQVYDLIFMPGFSTAENVSEVSGRGVGMDVVKRTIDELRGEVEIESKIGIGTTVTIKLPPTLSIIDTMLVQAGDQYYSIALSEISHCNQVQHPDIEQSNNDQIIVNGELIPYIHLRKEFNIKGEFLQKERVVVIKSGDQNIGLIVDKVIGEHQAVIKPLGDYFNKQDCFSGASILADGHLSIIIDTNKLIQNKGIKVTNLQEINRIDF